MTQQDLQDKRKEDVLHIDETLENYKGLWGVQALTFTSTHVSVWTTEDAEEAKYQAERFYSEREFWANIGSFEATDGLVPVKNITQMWAIPIGDLNDT